ncbi:MAG: hypothetical protein AAB734_00985 [Patescibacteria group bacterium]
MTALSDIVIQIIKRQEAVIGPLAWKEASKVQGLKVEGNARTVEMTESDQRLVVDRLVQQYKRLFGGASQLVCREAAAGLLANMPTDEIPSSLR